MKKALSAEQTRLLRLRSQRLIPTHTGKDDSPLQVLKDVIAVQAQDYQAARLAVRVRSQALTADQIDWALREDRSLIWTWCMRGTLHLLACEDAAWLIPLLGGRFIAADKGRMRQLGWDESSANAGIRLVGEVLVEGGELQRGDLVRLLQEHRLPSEGQAPFHLVYRAGLEGILCCLPGPGGKTIYVSCERWFGALEPLPRNEALVKLARRYLQAYAPANPEDLASWSGLPLNETRQAWNLLEPELEEVHASGRSRYILKIQAPWLEQVQTENPEVRLMPRYDTYWLGHAQRDTIIDAAHVKRIQPGGGVIKPFLLVNGKVLGAWSTQRRKNVLEVRIEPFEKLADGLLPLIEAEVADLGRFLGEKTTLSTD